MYIKLYDDGLKLYITFTLSTTLSTLYSTSVPIVYMYLCVHVHLGKPTSCITHSMQIYIHVHVHVLLKHLLMLWESLAYNKG